MTYRPNLNNRQKFNNKLVDIGIMIFTFILFVTVCLTMFTSCTKKDSDNSNNYDYPKIKECKY